ncbi:MAG: hypothetical protein A2041_10980 [Bacteroidetes bacterium GWA2_31_9b]|nr:MAG: hypothetical protein A2041_10980 [Bacteroidetes bacterium GWA2_31_9b]
MKNKFTLIKLMVFVSIIFVSFSCDNEETNVNIDKDLYSMAKSTSGFSWYKNSDEYLERSDSSGHSQPFLRTRYNSIAASMFDANGKILENSTFPDGSLIVKELVDANFELELYAILYKKYDNKYTDLRGWVWGYIDADGEVIVSASEKGSGCSYCHLQSEHIDYTLMNKYFP